MGRYAPYLGGALAVVVAGLLMIIVDARPVEESRWTEEQYTPIATSTADSARPDLPVQESRGNEASPATLPELSSAAARLRESLVNVWCTARKGNEVRSVSGSGVMIDPKGYVLTNAHVAQHFLLADRGMSCVLRMGSPAQGAYKAELAYLSPVWLEKNAHTIIESAPVGTGEHDVAILAITEGFKGGSSVPLARQVPLTGSKVAIVSYAAQYLNEAELATALFPTIVFSQVADILTFRTSAPDVLEFGGSVAAQEGASGGGVTNTGGELLGVITTSNRHGPLQERSITAITAHYVRREYAAGTGETIDSLLATVPGDAIVEFAPKARELQKKLEDVLDSK